MERRVEEANRRRVALQRAEYAGEVLTLVRQQLGQRGLPLLDRLGEDHLAHRVDAVALEEHVLGAGEADADRAERHRVLRLLRRVGVGADDHAGRVRAPLHQLLEVLELLGLLGRLVAVDQAGDDLRRRGLDLARVDLAGRAVDRHPVAFLEGLALDRHRAGLVVDFDRRSAADADLAHLPGDQRRVRRHAAARGEDAFSRDHAAQILRRRFDADQQHLLALVGGRHGAVGVQIDLTRCRARPGGQSRGDRLRLGHFPRVEHRRQQLLELIGGIAHHRRLPVDQLLLVHVHRELQRRHRGALAVARLQHVDDAFFDRELEVLDVLEMLLERLADALELGVGLRHLLLQLRHRLRRAHAGDDVLALRVDEELAVELLDAVGRVARETRRPSPELSPVLP